MAGEPVVFAALDHRLFSTKPPASRRSRNPGVRRRGLTPTFLRAYALERVNTKRSWRIDNEAKPRRATGWKRPGRSTDLQSVSVAAGHRLQIRATSLRNVTRLLVPFV